MKMTNMHAPKGMFMGAVQVASGNKITLPAPVMQLFGLKPGDELVALGDTEQGIALGTQATMASFKPSAPDSLYRGTVKLGTDGHLELPEAVRRMLDIRDGVKLMALGDVEQGIALRKAGPLLHMAAKPLVGKAPQGKWLGAVPVEDGAVDLPQELVDMFHLHAGDELVLLADKREGIALEAGRSHAWQPAEGKWRGSVRVGEGGRISLPEALVDMFNIMPGEHLLVLADVNRGIAIGGLGVPEEAEE